MINGTHLLTQGDVIERLRELPAGSVQCVVTSPPYWGLRDYGEAEQIGLEKTPEEYVEKMASVFREVRRVLRDDGTAWVNMGDSYAASGPPGGASEKQDSNRGSFGTLQRSAPHGLKPKDLCGMPWRLAFALQADGWYLRSDIIWSKPNPMPESVTDRPTKAHEYLFLLTKRAKYFYDADAVREKASKTAGGQPRQFGATVQVGTNRKDVGRVFTGNGQRNLRTVWHIPTQAYPDAHFATFPEKLVEPCIKAGTSEKGCCPKCGAGRVRVKAIPYDDKHPTYNAWLEQQTNNTKYSGRKPQDSRGMGSEVWTYYREVWNSQSSPSRTTGWRPGCECGTNGEPPRRCTVLDPFCGSGTVGVVACQLGRDFIGIDLSADYLAMAERRIGKALKPSTYVDRTAVVDAPLFVSV